MFQSFKKQLNGKHNFLIFSNCISEHNEEILERLKFKKITEDEALANPSLRKNSVCLCFDNHLFHSNPNKNKNLINSIYSEFKIPLPDISFDRNYYSLRQRICY